MVKPDLSVEIAGLKLPTPVLTASGTFGSGKEYADYSALDKLGAIVTKTLTFKPRVGNPTPRLCETPAGMLNSIGLQNKGVEAFVDEDMPFLRAQRPAVIVSIGGEDVDEYCRLAKYLSQVEGIDALEINISCPNVKKGGLSFGREPRTAADLVSTIRTCTSLPLIVKLSPNVSDITVIAKAVERAGAQAISLINTVLGMAVDINNRRPRLKTVIGGLSGPAIKPIALGMVWRTSQAVKVPIIGMGGISGPEDALEFMLAGASAIAVGTALFVDPRTPEKIIDGLRDYMTADGAAGVKSIVGSLKVES